MKTNFINNLNLKILNKKIQKFSDYLQEERCIANYLHLYIEGNDYWYVPYNSKLLNLIDKFNCIHNKNTDRYCNILHLIESLNDKTLNEKFITDLNNNFDHYNTSTLKHIYLSYKYLKKLYNGVSISLIGNPDTVNFYNNNINMLIEALNSIIFLNNNKSTNINNTYNFNFIEEISQQDNNTIQS